MSYARWGAGSDVYVFAHYLGWVECCGCSLSYSDVHEEFDSIHLHSREEVVEHMAEHQQAGHNIPTHLLDPYTYDLSDFEPYEGE